MAKIDTCNEALAEIGADTIASLDEASVGAAECNRSYAPALADLLEVHDWGFSIRRQALALKVNDRPGEWAYAYAKPSNVASLRRVLPGFVSTGAVAYPAWGWWSFQPWAAFGPVPYVEDASTIYTGLDQAVLEYSSSVAGEDIMPALFRRALVYELASRLAMPIRKDRQLKGDMIQMARTARAIAMADDENRYPRQTLEYVSDATLVRGGWPL